MLARFPARATRVGRVLRVHRGERGESLLFADGFHKNGLSRSQRGCAKFPSLSKVTSTKKPAQNRRRNFCVSKRIRAKRTRRSVDKMAAVYVTWLIEMYKQ